MDRYTTNHRAVAASCERAAATTGASLEDRQRMAGTAALMRLAAQGVKDPDQLRAASRAAREAVVA